MKNFIHPILSGIIASMATLVGEQCFSLPDYTVHHIGKLVFGLVAFLLLNQLMYRFQFNSYQLNGATISTLIIFLTQNIVIGLSRPTQLSYRWWIGVTLICSGVYVLYK
jgi:hypothetical protein